MSPGEEVEEKLGDLPWAGPFLKGLRHQILIRHFHLKFEFNYSTLDHLEYIREIQDSLQNARQRIRESSPLNSQLEELFLDIEGALGKAAGVFEASDCKNWIIETAIPVLEDVRQSVDRMAYRLDNSEVIVKSSDQKPRQA